MPTSALGIGAIVLKSNFYEGNSDYNGFTTK